MIISQGTGPRWPRLRLLAVAAVAMTMITIQPAHSIPIANPHSISSRGPVPESGFESKPVLARESNGPSSSSSLSEKRAVTPIAAPPPGQPQLPAKEYVFEILNPSPNDIWVSGMIEGVSWDPKDLPAHATVDISIIPADPETNPEAKILTRRPLLRRLRALKFYNDIIVPYDLLTRKQLMREQKGDGTDASMFNAGTLEGGTIPKESLDLDHVNETMTVLGPDETTSDISAQDFTSQARLVVSVYKAKTNTLLVQKSVFPVLIKRDHLRDLRSVLIDMEQLYNATTVDVTTNTTTTSTIEPVNPVEERTPEALVEGDDTSDEHDGDDSGEGSDDPEDDMSEGEDDMDMPKDMGHGDGHDEGQEQHEHDGEAGQHSGQGETKNEEAEDHHDHDPSHVIDPNHFENDEDVALWKEHEDDPGFNPPIKVEQAGTIQITKWIDNKERFFVGAPYVMAWEFPEDGQGLTGFVNVYVEDAETAKRYDIVAGNLPSDVTFMYLHPTEVMMSADPSKRIVLRARVELDLMKDGNFRRYTAFSKPFWVERGAL
ncbi:hypothetical protein BGZ59_005591 [Podila verticillata]|nr:hypothetical protein BGZ59_005591 [Podila verticillata]